MPERIGKYEILRTLGQGAMGEVYLAHHPAIGREVAIKTILPSAARGEDAEGRFRREAEAAGRLNHPNLVTIYDFDKDQDVLFLVMEYVKGDDLEDLIRNRALTASEYLEVLAQVCDGLGHAHRNGIIHRDIKPSNVRVARDGKTLLAKVMDFGVARVSDSSLTATGIVMGTVSYMAPEYIREGRATAQSDLFAVGVMLYECLAGRKPFAGDTTTTILFKIVSDNPEPLAPESIQGISPSVRGVLERCLAKDPAARPGSAEDLARALRACKDPTWSGTETEATTRIARVREAGVEATRALAATGATVVPASPGTGTIALPAAESTGSIAPVPPAVPGHSAPGVPARRRTALVVAACAVGLLAAGGGAVLALRPKPQPPAAPVVAPAPAPSPAPAPAAASPAPPAPGQAAPGQAAPGQAAPEQAAPVPIAAAAAVRAATSRPTASPSPRPAAPVVAAPAPKAPAPVPVAAPVAMPKPPAPTPEPKPAQMTPEEALRSATKLIDTDPRLAATQLKPLAQAQPGSVPLQGNYLAALYRCRNTAEFDRALGRATAAGVSVKSMLAVPAFRTAMADESKLQKSKAGVLPQEVMAKVLEGL